MPSDRVILPVALGVALLAVVEAIAGIAWFGWSRAPGVDLEIYLNATRRLLSGGSWFLERQVAGPYPLSMGDVLYPPVAIALFAPFLVLPWVLWWAVPIVGTVLIIRRWRPAGWVWLPIACCVLWPYTPAKLITGNPAMWLTMFVALAVEFEWPSALVFLKPSLFPFGLIGMRDRRWWAVVAGLGIASLLFAKETFQWVGVVLDAGGGGPLYSVVDVPLLMIPVIAWLGRPESPEPAVTLADVTHLSAARLSVPSTSDSRRPSLGGSVLDVATAQELALNAIEHAAPAPPLVAVVIPALNEAGKIGRVLDKFPRDGRFEAIVVDDGSTDGTGDEARAHGADLVIRHDHRGGVGAAIRDGWKAGLERRRPYLALLSGDDQHEPTELFGALDALLVAEADYLQGSRWMVGGRVVGKTGGRGLGTRVYSIAFSILAGRRVTDATNGFRIFRSSILGHPSVNLDQGWLDSYDLEPYVLYKAIRAGYRVIEHPCTVTYHPKEGYTKMRGIRDWWRLFRPALLLRTGVKR